MRPQEKWGGKKLVVGLTNLYRPALGPEKRLRFSDKAMRPQEKWGGKKLPVGLTNLYRPRCEIRR